MQLRVEYEIAQKVVLTRFAQNKWNSSPNCRGKFPHTGQQFCDTLHQSQHTDWIFSPALLPVQTWSYVYDRSTLQQHDWASVPRHFLGSADTVHKYNDRSLWEHGWGRQQRLFVSKWNVNRITTQLHRFMLVTFFCFYIYLNKALFLLRESDS